ncbi:MAG TPA: cupin domain-containing protein [Casimicrobiaceae bacterium]|nr:cupin domain-containing protein [Casimicrobiaceae bacterium]
MTSEHATLEHSEQTERSEPKHQAAEYVHRDDRDWETIRWPGQTGKMLFHPRPERPTEPNAGIVRYDAGSHHPWHQHDFAQVWYILSGQFLIGGTMHGPGTMVFYPDPHYEDELATETGGEMLFVQYPGPTTGGRPVYDGRFNMVERKAIEAERTDI